MSKRLVLFVAVLTHAGVVAMLVDGPTVAASGAVPVESMQRRMPSANGVDEVLEWNQIFNATVLGSVPAPNSLVTSRSAVSRQPSPRIASSSGGSLPRPGGNVLP